MTLVFIDPTVMKSSYASGGERALNALIKPGETLIWSDDMESELVGRGSKFIKNWVEKREPEMVSDATPAERSKFITGEKRKFNENGDLIGERADVSLYKFVSERGYDRPELANNLEAIRVISEDNDLLRGEIRIHNALDPNNPEVLQINNSSQYNAIGFMNHRLETFDFTQEQYVDIYDPQTGTLPYVPQTLDIQNGILEPIKAPAPGAYDFNSYKKSAADSGAATTLVVSSIAYFGIAGIAEAQGYGEPYSPTTVALVAEELGLVSFTPEVVRDLAESLAIDAGITAVPLVGQAYKAYQLFQSVSDAPDAYAAVKGFIVTVIDNTDAASPVGEGYRAIQENLERLEAGALFIADGVEYTLDALTSEIKAIGELDLTLLLNFMPEPSVDGLLLLMEELGIAGCFAAGATIHMANGSKKPIEDVVVGDLVMAFDAKAKDGRGQLVPRLVTETYINQVSTLLDFFGTKVTPGHVTLCSNGPYAGRCVPIIDILKSDGAIVKAEGTLIRAATNCVVGSDDDRFIPIMCFKDRASLAAGEYEMAELRLGTKILKKDMSTTTLREMLERGGMTILDNGLVRFEDGSEGPARWCGPLPRPEHYVLAKSGLTLADLAADPHAAEHATIQRRTSQQSVKQEPSNTQIFH